MDFTLSDTQRLIVDSVERWVGGPFASAAGAAGAASAASRGDPAQLGLSGLPLPQALGGHGGQAVDVMLVLQAFGRALVSDPGLTSAVLAGRALLKAGRAAPLEQALRRIASGELVCAWAHAETHMRLAPQRIDTSAQRDGPGWRLRGRKSQVVDAPAAGLLLVSARCDDLPGQAGLFAVDPRAAGVVLHPGRRIDEVPLADLELLDVRVTRDHLLDGVGDVQALITEVEDAGAAAACAEAVGAMDAALQLALEHLRTRRQFGVALATFQVLQHRAADMHIALELARSMAMHAATSLDGDDAAQRSAGVSQAKIVIGRTARQVGDSAIQLHGGMGMTVDHPVGRYVRKLAVLRSSFGDIDFHAQRLAGLGAALEEAF